MKNIGKPKAYRAVANACAKNPLLEIIPCHRVIRSDGKIGGYMGKKGIERKKRLLKSEGVKFLGIHLYPKTLIIIGVLFILVGLLYPFLKDIGLGRLPGDII